jgi:hypothetical protein
VFGIFRKTSGQSPEEGCSCWAWGMRGCVSSKAAQWRRCVGLGYLILHSRFRGCALGLEKRCDAIQSPSSTSWTKLPKHFYSVWVLNNQDNEGPCISVLFLSWPPCSPSPTFHLPRSSNFPSRQRIRPLISPRSGPDAFAPGLSRDYNKPLLSASIAKHALAFSQSISFPSPF